MKQFSQLRELTGRMPKGQHVFDKKVNGIHIMIHKDLGKFVAYVDGDRLDAYNSQKEAEKAATEFVKVLKK